MADAYEELGPLPGSGGPPPPLPPPPPPPPMNLFEPMKDDPYKIGALGDDDNFDLDSTTNPKNKKPEGAGQVPSPARKKTDEDDDEGAGKKKKSNRKSDKDNTSRKSEVEKKSPICLVMFFVSLLVLVIGLSLLIIGAMHVSGGGFIGSLKTS